MLVAAQARRAGAKLGERLTSVDVPVDDQLLGERVGEQHPQQVPLEPVEHCDAGVEAVLRLIPRQELPTRPQHVGGSRLHGLDQPDEGGRCFLRGVDR